MWGWYAALPDGTILDELTAARARKVTWKLRDHGTAGVTMTSGAADDQSTLLEELRTDLIITWDGRGVWRGRVCSSGDEIGEDEHAVTFGAVDYRGLLRRRVAHEALTYPATDTAQAAWRIVQHTQSTTDSGPGGALGIGKGTLGPIVTADVEVPDGKNLHEAIDDLATQAPGFDWWVDADMDLNVVPFRGTQRDFALILGDTVIRASRSFDSSGYANVVHQTGAEGLTPVIRMATDLASRPEGRWEVQEGNPDLTTQAAVSSTAQQNLTRRSSLAPSWQLTLRPGAWTPNDLWVGDLVRIVVRSGRLDVTGPGAIERIVEISVADDGDGPAKVTITLSDTLRQDLDVLMRTAPARLAQLARR